MAISVGKVKAKVELALARAQAALGTSYHITVQPLSKQDLVNAEGEIVMACNRTDRGVEDKDHFICYFNPSALSGLSWKRIMVFAGHEVIHMILFPLSEIAQRGVRSDTELSEVRSEIESVTYRFQRIVFGEEV